MAKRFSELTPDHIDFLAGQKVFFVATAMADGRINLSPKGLDGLRVLSPNHLIWRNLTGSGNETAAHLQHSERITIMACAFDGSPLILRIYGSATVFHNGEPGFAERIAHFEELPGDRQVIDVSIDMVQTSCGWGVPLMDFQGNRELLPKWAENQGGDGIKAYWEKKNQSSIDGVPTGIVEKTRPDRS